MSVLINPHRHERMPELDHLYVVTTIFNPMRYRSRYELYWEFKHHMEDLGARLMTVELAYGDRPFEVTSPGNPMHVQLRTDQEIWLKESALNVGVSRLPADWKYVAWFDSDIHFQRHDLLEEIVHQLQHYQIVQCWEDAIDLGPHGEVLGLHKGFVWSWSNWDEAEVMAGGSMPAIDPYYGGSTSSVKRSSRASAFHTGYAWAARRSAFQDLGGLLDIGILGASDHHLAWCLVGQVEERSPKGLLSPGYKRALISWQDRANTHIRQNIGHVPGSITHSFHGKKADRKYRDRWKILFKHNFDPDHDLKRDWQGLWALTHNGYRMRNDIRRYLLERNEDSIDL